MTPEQLAELFHTTYEKLAPSYGYETRPETAIQWKDISEDSPNKQLMIAVAGEILKRLESSPEDENPILLDRKKLKSYTYFWEWLQELGRPYQDVKEFGIQTIPIEVPSDNEWKNFVPNDVFTAFLFFNNGDRLCREGKFSEGKMTYIPFQDSLEDEE